MTIQLVGVEDNFTCQGKQYTTELTQGLNYLYDAINLWNLVPSPKGAQLYELIKWQRATTRGQEGLRVLGMVEIEHIVVLLSTFEQDLNPVMDEQEVVRPEALERFKANNPELLTIQSTETGPVYTLSNVLMSILNARYFFEGALCKHCEIVIEY